MKSLEEKKFERKKETFAKGCVLSFLKIFDYFNHNKICGNQRRFRNKLGMTFLPFAHPRKSFFIRLHLRLICQFFLLLILSSLPIFAENTQIVFPKNAFAGDTLEIKYIFHTDADFLPAQVFADSSRFILRADYDVFKKKSEDFFLKEIFLERLGSDYTLTLKLVPWKSGYLELPAFNLASIARFSRQNQNQTDSSLQDSFLISLKPVFINSHLETSSDKNFRPQASPKTLPGTFLYLALSFGFYLVLILAAIFLILRLGATKRFFKNFSYLLSLKKNSRKTAKKLKKLLNSSFQIKSDKDFAKDLQQILREFLNKRFARDFSSVPTSGIYSSFCDLIGGELSESEDDAVETLAEIFYRTDVIRYSPNQNFLTNERENTVKKSLDLLAKFDAEEKK